MKTIKIFSVLIVLCISLMAPLFADVTIKIVVANPSDSEKRLVPVRYNLPSGIEKDDVVDAGDFKIDYSVKDGLYYIQGEVELAPKESRTLQIVVKDIWVIPEEEIKNLMDTIDDKVKSIDEGDKKELAEVVGAGLKERLDSILKQQAEAADNIEKRMQIYSVNLGKLRNIKDEIFSLENMSEQGDRVADTQNSITLMIEAENTADQEVDIPLQYYLPKEIIPEYIIDAGEFELKYDISKEQFYLTKQENFKPNEAKRFSVEVKDVWYIPLSTIDRYLREAKELNEQLSDSDVAEIAKPLFEDIEKNAREIIESQGKFESINEHISTYRANQKRLALIKENLERLRALASTVEDRVITSNEAKSIQAVFKKIEAVTSVKLSKVAKSIAEKIKQVGVWKIVNAIVIFVIVLTIFFYGLWFFRIKKDDSKKYEKIETKNDTNTKKS